MHSCLAVKPTHAGLAPAARGGIPVETRIPASERTSLKLNDLLTTGVADGDARAELLKLAVSKIIEEALEAEGSAALGRDYYESGAEPGRGYRNGYRRGRLRTGEGPIEYGIPSSGRSDRAVRLARACRLGGPNGGALAARRRDVRARFEHARHRSGLVLSDPVMGHTTPTDSRSQRIRASRRGGQILTRALSSSYVSGLPSLRGGWPLRVESDQGTG
jgi:Transposase, Mutator family